MGRMVPRYFLSILITLYLTRCFVGCSTFAHFSNGILWLDSHSTLSGWL